MNARVTTNHDSRWYSGHFPDDPVLPGIAQLGMVADCITAAWEDMGSMTGLSRIKFRKIVRPGELLDIHAICDHKKAQCTFRITSNDEHICSGIMRFAKK